MISVAGGRDSGLSTLPLANPGLDFSSGSTNPPGGCREELPDAPSGDAPHQFEGVSRTIWSILEIKQPGVALIIQHLVRELQLQFDRVQDQL